MLDINLIRNEAEKVKSYFLKRVGFDPEPILSRDENGETSR